MDTSIPSVENNLDRNYLLRMFPRKKTNGKALLPSLFTSSLNAVKLKETQLYQVSRNGI